MFAFDIEEIGFHVYLIKSNCSQYGCRCESINPPSTNKKPPAQTCPCPQRFRNIAGIFVKFNLASNVRNKSRDLSFWLPPVIADYPFCNNVDCDF